MRIYIPVTVRMLHQLVAEGELFPVAGRAFAVTPALREAFRSGDDEELAEIAMRDAARASLRLLAAEAEAEAVPVTFRRAVLAADFDGEVRLRPDLDDAVVSVGSAVTMKNVASAHIDLAEAEKAVAQAVDVIDQADLGDTEAEFLLGEAEDHELAWYAAQELRFLVELL